MITSESSGTWSERMRSAAALLVSLGWVFVAATKITNLAEFAGVVASHGVVSRLGIPPLVASAVWAWLEMVVGVAGLWLPLTRERASRTVLLVSAMLMSTLAAYALIVWWHPPNSPTTCGCGLDGGEANWPVTTLRNAAITVVCLLFAVVPRGGRIKGRLQHREADQ